MAEERRRNLYTDPALRNVRGSLAVQPEVRPEVQEEERDLRKEARLKIEERVRENRLEAKAYSRTQLLVIGCALALILLAGVIYLQQVLEVRNKRNEAASLEKQYQQLVRDNALLENSYESHIDYAGIYEYAVGLGMETPKKQQYITYERADKEYVAKDGEIPDE